MLFNSLSNLSSIEKTEGSYSYVDIEFVNDHLEKANDNKEISSSFKCATCSEVFDENIHLENHVKSEHENQIKCSRCDKMFYTKCDMSNHFETIHLGFLEDSLKDFECEMCDDRFSNIVAMKKHKETDHIPIEYFTCVICEIIVISEEKLKKHKLKYHGSNCDCQFCGEQFNVEEELRIHKEENHEFSSLNKTFFNPSVSNSDRGSREEEMGEV